MAASIVTLQISACASLIGGAAPAYHNSILNAPNVWQLPVPPAALNTAANIFNEALMPHCRRGLIDELDRLPIPCTRLETPRGRFFVMRGGSSTNEELRGSSDLAWISVDDQETFDTFSEIFHDMGVAEAMAPVIDYSEEVRLYSCFYVVRSRCAVPNLHTDWDDAVGANAFTLLTPIADYPTKNFHLLYQTAVSSDPLKQYRYTTDEALVFSSYFKHSTEPGRSAEGEGPHVFLCFTFGSDKPTLWPHITPTISGYQSRILFDNEGTEQLTELGKYMRDKDASAEAREPEHSLL